MTSVDERIPIKTTVEWWIYHDPETMEFINQNFGVGKEYERQAAFAMWRYFGTRFPELMEKLGLRREVDETEVVDGG